MDQPASLLDFGVYSLSQYVDKLNTPEGGSAVGVVSYDWETNRISILAVPISTEPDSKTEAKRWCRHVVGDIRRRLGVNPETGAVASGTESIVSSFFSHAGYQSRKEPENLGAELDSIVEIRGVFQTKSNDAMVRCQGKLLSNLVFFSE